MKVFIKCLSKGIREGLKSLGTAFDDTRPRPYIQYLDLDTKEEIRKTWEEVGNSMRWAMDEIEKDPAFRKAAEDHANYDAHQNYLKDERKREEKAGHHG